MINLITARNAELHRHRLQQMFRQRHRVFRERLGWDVPSHNGMERDQFDRPDAVYLVASDDKGDVVGSWRLLPTLRPYMASTVFRNVLGDVEPPSDPGIWETSRFVVEASTTGDRSAVACRTTAELLCALCEFGIAYNIRQVISVQDPFVTRLTKRMLGAGPAWQSRMQRIGNSMAMAAVYDVTGSALDHLRSHFNVPAPIISELRLIEEAA